MKSTFFIAFENENDNYEIALTVPQLIAHMQGMGYVLDSSVTPTTAVFKLDPAYKRSAYAVAVVVTA